MLSTVVPVRLSVVPQRSVQFQGEPASPPPASEPQKAVTPPLVTRVKQGGASVMNWGKGVINWVSTLPARHRANRQANAEANTKVRELQNQEQVKTVVAQQLLFDGVEGIFQKTRNITPVLSNQAVKETGTLLQPTVTYSATVAYGDNTFDVTVVKSRDTQLETSDQHKRITIQDKKAGDQVCIGDYGLCHSTFWTNYWVNFTDAKGNLYSNRDLPRDKSRWADRVFGELGLKMAKLVMPQQAAQA